MKIFRYIVVLILGSLFLAPSVFAITTEQEQQFSYYWYAARQALEEEQYDKALVLLEFCQSIKPNDGQTLAFLGRIYEKAGEHERALATYRAAFEADPYDQWLPYSKKLLNSEEDADAKQTIAVLEKAYSTQKGGVKDKKVDENLLNTMLSMYLHVESWKKALAIQDELDRQKGYDAYSALTRYRIYAMWDKPKQAIAAINKYLELDPNDVRFLMFRLELMEKTGAKVQELYAMYDRILELTPLNLMVLNNYAYHLATHGGDLKKAERMSAVTIREDTNNPVYLDTYGWILHMQGQDELALFFQTYSLMS